MGLEVELLMHIIDVWIPCVCSHTFVVTAFGVWDCPKCQQLWKVEGSKNKPKVTKVAGK